MTEKHSFRQKIGNLANKIQIYVQNNKFNILYIYIQCHM